jgi:hypothetical protein
MRPIRRRRSPVRSAAMPPSAGGVPV